MLGLSECLKSSRQKIVMQPCSVAKLLSATLDIPLEESYFAVGLVLCPICEQPSEEPQYYPYCCKQHRDGRGITVVPLVCEECEVLFYRRETDVLHRSKRGQDHIWCSKQCQGKWWARNYGISTRPHDRALGAKALRAKTHCRRGHPFNAENTYWTPNNTRLCRTCHNAWRRTAYEAKKTSSQKLSPE